MRYTGNMETQDEYKDRMKRSPQFAHYGIEPQWHPGEGDIDGFCHDEVVRQFHDTRVPGDGGKRVDQMKRGWEYAQASSGRKPDIDDILTIGHLVEPESNSVNHFRRVNVTVGNHYPPHSDDVPSHMASLASSIPDVRPCDESCGGDNGKTNYYETSGYGHSHPTPDDFYIKAQQIHPFADGNGRSFKIIHNWLSGTLDEPKLVPDYFGGGNP